MMYSYLRYLLLDSAISCVFERIEALFVAPEYRKVRLSSLVGKRVACLWLYHDEIWLMYVNVLCNIRNVPYDRYIRYPLNYDFAIRYPCPVHINTRSLYLWLDDDVYVSDTVSHIPPWGMLDL
jgi:hypothetical protein